MIGYIPGARSSLEAFRDFAIITGHLIGKHGSFLTGLFYMLIGCVLAAMFYLWGDYLRRSDGNGGGSFGDCGDGGD